MSISYHTQFRENQRNKFADDLLSNSKATTGGQRPTAVVKQPIRSDTFTLPTKRQQTNSTKVPKINQIENNDNRQQRFIKPLIDDTLPPAVLMKKTGNYNRSTGRQRNPIINQLSAQRRPVRFAQNFDDTYYSASSPPLPPPAPAYYPKSAPLPRDNFDDSTRLHNSNEDYAANYRKPPTNYNYSEYQTVSDLPLNSYQTSLPPINQSTHPTVIIHPNESSTRSDHPPTVVIHSKEPSFHSESPPKVILHSKDTSYPTILPTYNPSSAPLMFLPNTTTPTSTMFLPNTTAPTSTMFLPNSTTAPMFFPTQAPLQTFLLQPQLPPPLPPPPPPVFYPFPRPIIPPPAPAPPPPPVPQTIINQSSSSSTAAPTTVHTENRTEENNATIFLHPNTITNSKKNVTIQLKMLDEDNPRIVRLGRDIDDVYYVNREPDRVMYERPRYRTAFYRRPAIPNEYVYVEDSPIIHPRRPYRSEFAYVDYDRPPLEYEEEIVYVDNNGNEIEYIYDDRPRYHRKSHRSSVANIVYE